jgi:hypothetical protein
MAQYLLNIAGRDTVMTDLINGEVYGKLSSAKCNRQLPSARSGVTSNVH